MNSYKGYGVYDFGVFTLEEKKCIHNSKLCEPQSSQPNYEKELLKMNKVPNYTAKELCELLENLHKPHLNTVYYEDGVFVGELEKTIYDLIWFNEEIEEARFNVALKKPDEEILDMFTLFYKQNNPYKSEKKCVEINFEEEFHRINMELGELKVKLDNALQVIKLLSELID